MKKNKSDFEELIVKACNLYTEKEKKTNCKKTKEKNKNNKSK